MKSIKFLQLAMIFTLCISFLSCEGPAGIQGVDGRDGRDGINGINGIDGNANVHTKVLTSSSWTYSSTGYSTSFTDYDITQNILDAGMVYTYVSNGANGWIALPMTWYPSTTYSYTYSSVHSLNRITFWRLDSDNIPTNPGTQTFKIIAVSGSLSIVQQSVNWGNYNDVKQKLNLKD